MWKSGLLTIATTVFAEAITRAVSSASMPKGTLFVDLSRAAKREFLIWRTHAEGTKYVYARSPHLRADLCAWPDARHSSQRGLRQTRRGPCVPVGLAHGEHA